MAVGRWHLSELAKGGREGSLVYWTSYDSQSEEPHPLLLYTNKMQAGSGKTILAY